MTANQQKKGSNALPIAIMFALFFMIAFVTGYQNPLGDVIKNLSGGSTVLTQLGTMCNFIAYLFMGYPAGKLLERAGYRVTALWAVSVGFAGVAVTYLSGFIADNMTAVCIYMLGAFIAGFSMCMLNAVVNPLLNSLGKDQNAGNQLVQFGGTLNSCGATLAPVIVGGLIGGQASSIASANPVFYMAMGIFAAAFAVLYFAEIPERADLGKKKEELRIADALRFPNLRWGLVCIFCYIGIEVGVANFTYQYLQASEIVTSQVTETLSAGAIAGTVVGIYWLMMLVGRLIGGIVGAKISSRQMMVVTCGLGILLLCLGIFMPETAFPFIGFDSSSMSFNVINIPLNAVMFILCGLCTSVQWGATFNLAVEGVGKYTPVASGLFMTMVFGGAVWTPIQGVLFESISPVGSFVLPIALWVYMLIYAVALSKPVSETRQALYEDGVKC